MRKIPLIGILVLVGVTTAEAAVEGDGQLVQLLLERFDTDQDGWLDVKEKAAARNRIDSLLDSQDEFWLEIKTIKDPAAAKLLSVCDYDNDERLVAEEKAEFRHRVHGILSRRDRSKADSRTERVSGRDRSKANSRRERVPRRRYRGFERTVLQQARAIQVNVGAPVMSSYYVGRPPGFPTPTDVNGPPEFDKGLELPSLTVICEDDDFHGPHPDLDTTVVYFDSDYHHYDDPDYGPDNHQPNKEDHNEAHYREIVREVGNISRKSYWDRYTPDF